MPPNLSSLSTISISSIPLCFSSKAATRIAGLLEEVKHKNREDVLYSREGSNMFVGKVRDSWLKIKM